jgi:hypothetical protein
MFKDERAFLFLMTVETFVVFAQKQLTTGCANVGAMHIMTIGAFHKSFTYRVVMLQGELAFDLKVTGEACFRIAQNDLAFVTITLGMERPWPVTAFAALNFTCFCILFCDIN